jgi:DNA-binding CsgD family transcriptional regulator
MQMIQDLNTGDDNALLAALLACLEKCGSTGFNQAFTRLATEHLGADQCMIFSYSSQTPRCFLSFNDRPKGEARALAEKYVVYGHESDPMTDRIKKMSRCNCIEIVPLNALKDDMSAGYWKDFYEAPGLVDKMAILASKNGLLLCLNFYRFEESGPYKTTQKRDSDTLWKIAAQLALTHYKSSDDHSLEDPLLTLSDREQEVCRWILKGLTTEAIAYEMDVSPNTIATFRKRAYEKLSINSKSALFGLCQS